MAENMNNNEEINVITLYDEENNAEDYEIIDVFEFKDALYAAVTPFQEEYDEESPIEITKLRVTESDGEECFSIIESEEEELAAYEELLRRDEEYED